MTDTTHEAPEWIFTTGNSTTGLWNSKKSRSRAFKGLRQTQYIRADLVQAAVAAALKEAANRAGEAWTWTDADVSAVPCQEYILALITPDAQAALDRVVAAERARIATWLENTSACYTTKGGSLLPRPENSLGSHAGTIYAAAIRKGGE